jgi:dolichyl-phosphate-mannose-protein mannosyltransferase
MRTALTAVLLGLVSFGFFMRDLGNPPDYLLDEVQYVSSAKALLSNSPNPNPEAPPLGKLMIAIGIKLLGDTPIGWRVMSAVFGSLTLAGIFLWVHLLVDEFSTALIASILTLFNNFVFVFSRAALMDNFLVGFMVCGLLAFTAALKLNNFGAKSRRILLLCSGAMFGFSCASKWNGVDTLGVVVVVSLLILWAAKRSSNPETRASAAHLRCAGVPWLVLSFLIVPLLAYSMTFLPLLHSEHRPFSLRELYSANLYIWRFHRAVVGNIFLAVPWYKWPFRVDPLRSLSYLVGNWYVMWAGIAALLLCARRFGRSLPETLVVLLYAANFLQWIVTPQRYLYYYYYYAAELFLGIAIPLALRQFPKCLFGVRLGTLIVLPALCVFAYCYPRMAHLPQPFDCALGCWP